MTTKQVEIRARHLKDFFTKLERNAQVGMFEVMYSSHVKNIFYELFEKAHDYVEEIHYETYEKILGRDMM